jgi:hypothetical protein
MGKSILELFKNKKLTSGVTPEKQYDVRNSKDISVSSANGALNKTAFPAVNKLRKSNLSIQRGETFIEQETTGLRPLRLLSEPIIYGTDIIRINTQTTTIKDVMKAATGADGSEGLVGGLISKLKLKGLELASKVGIKLPYDLIPTRIAQDSEFRAGKEGDTMITLAKIKGDSAGNLVGKFLANNATGTPSQIGNAIIGGGIDLLKNEIKNKLLGGGLPDQRVYAKKSENQIQYDSTTPYTKTVNANSTDALTRHDLSSLLVQRTTNQKTAETGGSSTNKLKAGSRLPTPPKEEAPINTKNQPFASITDRINSVRGDMLGKLAGARKEGQQILARTPLQAIPQKDNGTPVKKSEMVDASADDPKLRNDLSTKIMALYNEKNPAYATDGPIKNEKKHYSKLKNEERVSMAVTRRMGFGYGRDLADTADIINNSDIFEGLSKKDAKSGNLDDYDFIPLKFYSVAQNKTVQFRATITGLSESTSPSWDSNKFMGSPFSYYTYTGVERSVQFNFKVYSLNEQEHIAAWDKLNFLTSLAYPQGYSGLGVIAPLIKLTLGNMYNAKTGFIESLTYTIDDNGVWEIGLDASGNIDGELKNYKLPRVIDVGLTIKFVENKSTTNTVGTNVSLYGIGKDGKGKAKKPLLKGADAEPNNPSTDIAKGSGTTTTAASVVNSGTPGNPIDADSKGVLSGIDSRITAKASSFLSAYGAAKTTGTQVNSLGIAGYTMSKEFAAATMKFDGLKSVAGITGKYSVPGIDSYGLTIPDFNTAAAFTPRYSIFNADGTIRTPSAALIKTNSFTPPTAVRIVGSFSTGKNEKPIKLSRTQKKELERTLAERIIANNTATYESFRNDALKISGLGK